MDSQPTQHSFLTKYQTILTISEKQEKLFLLFSTFCILTAHLCQVLVELLPETRKILDWTGKVWYGWGSLRLRMLKRMQAFSSRAQAWSP